VSWISDRLDWLGVSERVSLADGRHHLELLFNNRDVSERLPDMNQSGVEFLLIDLDLAMTFLDIAETSRIEETRRRNNDNARTAHDTVVRLLAKLRPTLAQRHAIDAKVAILKTRLQAVGQQL
jgi:hypothetical protein